MDPDTSPDVCVIGGGPAGLAAAEAAVAAGARVLLADRMPSLGRKLLMAGKSGLNLTMAEDPAAFAARIMGGAAFAPALALATPERVRAWAEGLGQPLFTGSSGRVFPVAMKASPLLRAWLGRLAASGVAARTRWRWTGGLERPVFDTPAGVVTLRPRAVVLAVGGASWPRLGSDGQWTALLPPRLTRPFAPSNAGLRVDWSSHMVRYFGAPAKPVTLTAGARRVTGECVPTARGLEGSAVYALTPEVRAGHAVTLDLLPDLEAGAVARRLSRPRGKASLANHLRRTLRLTGVKAALLREAGPPPGDPAALAARIKAVPLAATGPMGLEGAISSVGGLALDAVGPDLALTGADRVFCAGEMLDWDAPTGGYLISACLGLGWAAGRAAAVAALGPGGCR